jgi:hypothetical protein
MDAEVRSGRVLGFPVACIPNGVVALVAPQAAKPLFTAPIYKICSSTTPLDCVCCLGLNCKLAIPVLVKGSWPVKGMGKCIGCGGRDTGKFILHL